MDIIQSNKIRNEMIGEQHRIDSLGIKPHKGECLIKIRDGYIAVPGFEINEDGVDYIRILNENKEELMMWDADEWREEPVFVMGAIFGMIYDRSETEVVE